MAGRLEKGVRAVGALVLLLALFPVAKVLLGFEPFAFDAGLLFRTALQAGLSAALAMALSLPLAWALGENSVLSRLARPLTLFPAVMPPIVMVAAATSLFGYSGLLPNPGILYSFWGIIIVHALYNFPLAARLISNSVSQWQGYSDISKTMSAGPLARLARIWLPLLRPALLGVFWVIYAYCFTSFSIPLIFGGGASPTLETEIYSSFFSRLDFGKAAFLAIIQIAAMLPAVALLPSDLPLFQKPAFSPRKSVAKKIVLAAYLLAIAGMLASPLLKMEIAPVRAAPVINSLAIGALSATLSLLLFAALPGTLRKASYAIIALSSSTLALAYAGFAGNWLAVVLVHAVLSLHAFQLALGRRVESAMEQAKLASVMGAGYFRRLVFVAAPALRKELAMALMLAFFISNSELALVQTVSAGQFDTISTVMLSAFSNYRFSEGIFYSFLLILMSVAAMFFVEWLDGA